MKRALSTIAILSLLGAAVLLARHRSSEVSVSESVSTAPAPIETAPVAAVSPAPVAPSPKAAVQQTPRPGFVDLEKTKVVALAPSLDQYREDVAKDPHEPPPSLIRFAADLSKKFDAAVASPEKGAAFIEELQDCIQKPELRSVIAVPSLCLANIRRYGQKVPSFKEKTEAIYRQADASLKE